MSDFHFIRPMWFIALLALPVLVWLIKRLRQQFSGWQNIIPAHLQHVLMGQVKQQKSIGSFLPTTIFILSIIALAGPTYQKLPQPVFSVERGSVIVMDMSFSMYSTDIAPNRLTRARYKAIDILEHINEGDIGLVAYAGDAFVISPLTQDINNIKLLLPSLTPEIMPEIGSDPFPALLTANDMLVNAGHLKGDIYWLTDDADHYDAEAIQEFIRDYPHRLNILGVGSSEGAPIKLPNGELLKDDRGQIVIPKLPKGRLQGLAKQSGGVYQTITNNDVDVEQLTAFKAPTSSQENEQDHNKLGDSWQELGPYILVLILPLVLSYFRRGIILSLLPFFVLIQPMNKSYAQETTTTPVKSTQPSASQQFWQDLWQTADQQAQVKYEEQQYFDAAQQFKDQTWQASAHFKAGNYEQALEGFSQFDSAQAKYNIGNTLAKLNKLQEAIEAYDSAIALQPDFQEAIDNKKLLEELLKQQEQQQQDNQNQGDQQNEENDQNQDDQQSQDQNEGQRNQQQNQENNQDQSDNESSQDQQDQSSEKQDQDQSSEQQDQEKESDEQQEQEQQSQQSEQEAQEQKTPQEQQLQAAERSEQQQKELDQKHRQLLNKVTDDPHLLLRNKMQLEYQKRRHQNSGAKKKW